MKKVLRYSIYSLLGIIASMLVYVGVGIILSSIVVNAANESQADELIDIYILSNGVHTDIVTPIKSDIIDWDNYVKQTHKRDTSSNYTYLAFGWGDKGFYLNTPTWDDLTFKTAFCAAFGLSETAMHCSFHNKLQPNETCKKLNISSKDYEILVNEIKNSFEFHDGKVIHINNEAYGINDCFYEATGKYSLFKTCNSWTNSTLKTANQKSCVWTPTDWPILSLYK